MNGRAIFRVLAALLLVVAAFGIGAAVYNAGVTAGLAEAARAAASGDPAPLVPYGYGYPDGLYVPDRALLERTLAETHRLERLIEDLRTLSMADAGALSLQREPTDLGALAADVVAAFEPQAASGRVALAVEAVDGLPDLEVDLLRVSAR